MAEKQQLSQAEFKKFERVFNAIRAANREERKEGVGLMTPALIKKHIASGKPLVLRYGKSGKFPDLQYTAEDLKKFQDAIEKSKVVNRAGLKGVPLKMLENASSKADYDRMRGLDGLPAIRSATAYKISGNTIFFRVSGSGATKGGKQFYQVRVRLEQWDDLLTGKGSWMSLARAAAVGRISFDCQCGRHQYWFRYLAHISNCAVEPPKEQDFPKIKNPGLDQGFCCKHTLKAFQQLKSGLVHRFLATEMEKQASSIGYAGSKARILNAQELALMDRARGSDKDHAAAVRALKDFNAARKAFAKKLKEPSVKEKREQMKVLRAENLANKKRAEAAERQLKQAKQEANDQKMRNAQLERDALVGKIGMFVMRSMLTGGKDRSQAISEYAEQNNMSVKDVDDIAKESGV